VEANLTSGALITANFATEYGHQIFAVPGRVRACIQQQFSNKGDKLSKEPFQLEKCYRKAHIEN
jgi:predicted Rossmann fold nucleotide-binding protein DprA/Smf involved in DNA uptake